MNNRKTPLALDDPYEIPNFESAESRKWVYNFLEDFYQTTIFGEKPAALKQQIIPTLEITKLWQVIQRPLISTR